MQCLLYAVTYIGCLLPHSKQDTGCHPHPGEGVKHVSIAGGVQTWVFDWTSSSYQKVPSE